MMRVEYPPTTTISLIVNVPLSFVSKAANIMLHYVKGYLVEYAD